MLSENGIIFAAVPNSHLIHRQAAVLMRIPKNENTMSALDKHHGHRRVYLRLHQCRFNCRKMRRLLFKTCF